MMRCQMHMQGVSVVIILFRPFAFALTSRHYFKGKADPVQRLKKQLAEKDKALTEEQEALAGAQAKLREMRTEMNAERAQLQQRSRSLEEAFQAKHVELQASGARLQAQAQKLQQLQVQLNDEHVNVHKLREENGALQVQRQQVELRLSQAQEVKDEGLIGGRGCNASLGFRRRTPLCSCRLRCRSCTRAITS